MNACGPAVATRSPQHEGAKPKAAGDCCTEALSTEAGLPRFLDGVQTKLEVGAPDDAFEREADAVAESVQRDEPVRAPRIASSVPRYQRLCADCAEQLAGRSMPANEDGLLQRLADDGGGGAPPERAGGETSSGLAHAVRARLEHGLGTDLGDVRVHTGPAADALAHRLAAKAFTHGHDIWLGAHQRPEDLGLMAHEVTHVLQQTGGAARPNLGPDSKSKPDHPEKDSAAPGRISAKESPGDEDGDEGANAEGGPAAGAAAGGAEGGEEGRRDWESALYRPDNHAAYKAIRDSGAGHSLAVQLRRSMEQSFGVDLREVRVHDDDAAHHAADIVDAEAFSLGQAIYFGRGRYRPDSPAGHQLLAHELAHVVQNRRAGVAGPPQLQPSFSLSRPGDTAEREADSAADAIAAGRPAQALGRPTGQIQRGEKNAFGRALDWSAGRLDDATSTVASGARAAEEFAGKHLMSLLRTVAPQVADIIDEGPINFAKRKINEALDAHLPAALGGFSLGELIDAVSGWLGEAASFAKSLLKGDAKACAAFAGMMDKLTQFITKLIDNPVIKTFTGALTEVSDFIGKAVKFVAAPIFDALAAQVSGAWSVLKKVASTVSGWISSAKTAIGSLWDQLMKAMGFDGSSEDGVWAHIKKVGNEIWETIKAKMAPVVEPLKKVASVVSLLTPMGQVHAIVKYGPKLVKVAQWIWDNGLDPAKIQEAPEEIRGMLTDLTGGVSGFKGVLQSGLDWLSEKVSSLADAVLGVVSSISGLPLIGFAHDLFDEARKTLKTLVADIEKGAKDALAAIEATATKISDFISPYKEVISSLILAIASPPMIPVILAGWAWRALPSCVKVPILNFILDIAIAALEAIPEVPTFGLLWPLLKPGVMAFLGTLRAAEDSVKEQVSDKIAKVISGASPEFLIGFVKGFATGVWEGITDPFKAIWTVLEGLDSATQYLLSLAGFGEETEATKQPLTGAAAPAPAAGATPAHAPAAPASAPAAAPKTITAVAPAPTVPVAAPAVAATMPETVTEVAYAADPAAALKSSAAMPESTRKLLEKLALQQAGEKKAAPTEAEAAPADAAASSMAPEDMPALKERASAMAGELSPDVETVKGGFWDAVQEYFSGDGMSFDDMVTKLSEAWESAKTKISEGAAWLANQLMGFFRSKGAESELGDKIGWLTGTIVFQVLLDYITAGTWAGAGPVLKGIAKFINWPMEALGEAFKLLKTLGKYLLEGLKSLGSVIKDAAAGAFKTVSKALGNIGERLIAFGEEIIGKFGGKAAKAETKAAGVLGREGTKLAEAKVGKQALSEAEEKAAQKLEQQAGKVEPHPTAEPKPEPTPEAKTGETIDVDQVPPESAAKREASVAESGHVESDKLTPRQARNETDQFRNRPESLEGTAPHRKSKAGEHEWREESLPDGECQFCRYSSAKVCVNTPELRASELGKTDKHVAGLEEQAEAQAKAAAQARKEAIAHQPLTAGDEKYLNDTASEAAERAKAAKKRLGAERGKVTKLTKAGKADEAALAQKRVESLEAELKRAEEEARTAKEMLAEQERLLKKAKEAEALAKATKAEAEAAGETAKDIKAATQKLEKAEAKRAELLTENRNMMNQEIRNLDDEIARQRTKLAEKIEASRGLTPEARDTLRKGTPFKGAGGAERERAFLESLPPEAKGPNGTYVDYVTGETLPLSALHPDHVVPVDQIFDMEGFGRLSRADQQAILDMPQNLRYLEKGRNLSKGSRSFTEWLASKTADKAPNLSTPQRQALLGLEAKARTEVEAEIAKRLKKLAAP